MPCCTPEVLLSEQSAIAEFPLSFCYLFVLLVIEVYI